MDVTVIRSKWYRGKGAFLSKLLLTDESSGPDIGKMCCLGFASLAAGYSEADIGDIASPQWLYCASERLPGLVIGDSVATVTDTCERMTFVNDAQTITDSDREPKLISLGKEAGINFTFVD